MNLEVLCKTAHDDRIKVGMLDTDVKNETLRRAADKILSHEEEILAANAVDVTNGKERNMPAGLLDRLTLNHDRLEGMADGLRQIAKLDDPIGEVLSMKNRPNGLRIGKKRVPLGVVGIIYESRPNVTADAFGLCFKTGNAVILRGGSDAINSNKAIVQVIKAGLRKARLSQDLILLVEDTSRETVTEMMRLHDYIDVLIPRGGAGLIASVVANSTVPVIETGTGNCHIYVDESADVNMAAEIIENAKTQRLGVCNACESLVIHESILEQALPAIAKRLKNHQVEIRGDEKARAVCTEILPASEEDWGTEYLDAIISVKTVASLDVISTGIIPDIPSRSLQKIMTVRCVFRMRSMQQQCMSMRPPDLQMDLNLGLAQKSGSVRRNCMREGRWGWKR